MLIGCARQMRLQKLTVRHSMTLLRSVNALLWKILEEAKTKSTCLTDAVSACTNCQKNWKHHELHAQEEVPEWASM